MTDTKQPEALRLAQFCRAIARGLLIKPYIKDLNVAAALLERQHAEIEALQDDLAHKDDYAEQLGHELAKADSVIKELRSKLDELEEQEPYKYMGRSGTLFNERIPGIESKALYLAAGARPVEPAPAAQDDAKPHWSVNRYCRAGMCLKTDDRHEHDCPHGCNTIDAAMAADKKEPT